MSLDTVHCSGTVQGGSEGMWPRLDRPFARVRRPDEIAEVMQLYDFFSSVGLQYGPGFRMLEQAWAGQKCALSRLCTRVTPQGTPQAHPADLDGALQLGAFLPAGSEDGETRVPFSVDEARLQAASGELWASIERRSAEALAVGLD
eukprot:5828741-Prymnesium_polylepis.1